MTDILDYLAQLPPLENYTANDRFHDFKKVFTSTPEGKRALRYILERGGVFQAQALASPIDSHMLATHDGKRRMALEILAFVYNEPKGQPPKQTRKRQAR